MSPTNEVVTPSTSSLFHRSLHNPPHLVTSAKGNTLHLSAGGSILDACGGAAVSILPHPNEEVISAAVSQFHQAPYVHTLSYSVSANEELASFLLSSRPGGLCRAYFCCSGSEAIKAGLKLSRQYFVEIGQEERVHFISRHMSYHGNTFGAISVSGHPARRSTYEPLLMPNTSKVSPANAYRYKKDEESEEDYVGRLATELDAEFRRVGPERVIAFIAEPVVGATTGCVIAPKGYFRAVREVCDRYGALLILDEVMCGMGRTGTLFAFEQEDVRPDIVAIGKALSSGYAPISAMLAGEKVVNGLYSGSGAYNHGHTYQAHPVSCAVALAVQRCIKREKLIERVQEISLKVERKLRETLEPLKHVGNIRGRGLFWGVEFVKDKATKEPFEAHTKFGYRVQLKAFDLGVALYPGVGTVDGVRGDHVVISPAYTVTEEQIDTICGVLKEAHDAIAQDLEGHHGIKRPF